MKPIEDLVHEHEVINLVLKAAEQEAGRMRGPAGIDLALVEKMLDFFKNFTDRCHHAKEEGHLFPMLEAGGLPPDKGSLAALLSEHEEGRRLVSRIGGLLPEAARGDHAAVMSSADGLAAYARLLEDHIAKENSVFFPLADRMLSDEDKKSLEKAFAKVEEEETGEGVHERYHLLAHEISGLSGRGAEE